MTPQVVYSLASVALFCIGLYGVAARDDLIRKLLSLNVMGGGVFLLLVTLSSRGSGPPDPVPQAMVLTGIVVAVSVTAFALALVRRIHEAAARAEPVAETEEP